MASTYLTWLVSFPIRSSRVLEYGNWALKLMLSEETVSSKTMVVSF